MAALKASKARIYIDGEGIDLGGIGYSFNVPGGNNLNAEELGEYVESISSPFEVSFTAQISEGDSRNLLVFFHPFLFPEISQYRWLCKRAILNPKHTKYKAYLRG